MITSPITYLTPFKRKRQKPISYKRDLESLSGNTPHRVNYKRVDMLNKEIGNTVFKVVAGGTIDDLSNVFINSLKHGVLLSGNYPNFESFMAFVHKNK